MNGRRIYELLDAAVGAAIDKKSARAFALIGEAMIETGHSPDYQPESHSLESILKNIEFNVATARESYLDGDFEFAKFIVEDVLPGFVELAQKKLRAQ